MLIFLFVTSEILVLLKNYYKIILRIIPLKKNYLLGYLSFMRGMYNTKKAVKKLNKLLMNLLSKFYKG